MLQKISPSNLLLNWRGGVGGVSVSVAKGEEEHNEARKIRRRSMLI